MRGRHLAEAWLGATARGPSRCALVTQGRIGVRSAILCGHPLTGVGRFPNLAGGSAGLPSARPSSVADVHNHALTQPNQNYRIWLRSALWTTCVIPPHIAHRGQASQRPERRSHMEP
jgi:hypothetical protein